jgi:aspartyl/asparaginyl beta-hydroxylase (cupin superfamily)
VFDDTIEHEAMNPTDELRVVFIFDVWHPDLSPIEQEAIAALIGNSVTGGGAL